MKVMLGWGSLLLLGLSVAAPAVAQGEPADPGATPNQTESDTEDQPITQIVVLDWLEDQDWSRGMTLAIVGGIAATLVAFTFAGTAMPGTTLASSIDERAARLSVYHARLDDALRQSPPDTAVVAVLSPAIDQMDDNLRSDRKWGYLFSMPLYVALGAASAAALATDVIQAFAVGVGGPTALAAWASKSNSTAKMRTKNDALDAALQTVSAGRQGVVPPQQADAVEEQIAIARKV